MDIISVIMLNRIVTSVLLQTPLTLTLVGFHEANCPTERPACQGTEHGLWLAAHEHKELTPNNKDVSLEVYPSPAEPQMRPSPG